MKPYRGANLQSNDEMRAQYPREWQFVKNVHPDFNHLEPSNVYSQYGEDGLIAGILNKIGVKWRTCFEVGATDGDFFSNTKVLREKGWQAVLIESNPRDFRKLLQYESPFVICVNAEVTPEEGLDFHAGIHFLNFDLGIIDIDGLDYEVWETMEIRPRIMIVESSEFWGTHETSQQKSRIGLCKLGDRKQYTLVAQTFCNSIFVSNESLKGIQNVHHIDEG